MHYAKNDAASHADSQDTCSPEQTPAEKARTTEHARQARRFWLREARAQVRRARDLRPFVAPGAVTREALLAAFDFCLETARLYRHWARSVLA